MSALTDLMKMKKEELQDMAAELGLPSGERQTKQQLVSKIISKQKEPQADTETKTPEPLPSDEVVKVFEPNPEFERLISKEDTDDQDKKDSRGGARPGAGRPKGSTAEICAVRALSTQPNESVKAALEALFLIWSFKCGVAEVRLTKDEAIAMALPYTQVIELCFGEIPQSLHVWIMLLWTTFETFEKKVKIILAAKQQPKFETPEVAK